MLNISIYKYSLLRPSTDYDVHRNWKTITTSLPINQWYFDKESIWTLDYPPLFAYMEYILGKISTLFTSKVTDRSIKGDDWEVIFYQRMTVLIGDVLLFFAIRKLCRALTLPKTKFFLLLVSIQSFAGLVIVDNIHFQYNTILFSIFFFSIAFIAEESFIFGAIVFSIAVCLKHIFVYMAPAFVIFYLQNYAFRGQKIKEKVIRLIKVGIAISSVGIISFSPFIIICLREKNINQFIQIKNQLFPFQRGLLHSYWAPNIWAIYSFVDKVLFFITKSSSSNISINTSALGVTQETFFNVLPDISTATSTIILVTILIIFMTRRLIFPLEEINIFELKNVNSMTNSPQRKKQNVSKIVKDCMISNLIFFNFGYQVHEKAFIIISLLMIIYFFCQEEHRQIHLTNIFLITLSIGILAQVPLIHDYRDYIPKLCLVITYFTFIIIGLLPKEPIYKPVICYISISLALDFINIFKPINYIDKRYPFLPLMSYSVLSACFVQILFITFIVFEKLEILLNN